jgi:hypothetical protein
LLNIKPSEAKKVYPYALLYVQAKPEDYGYTAANLIWENEVVRLYKR